MIEKRVFGILMSHFNMNPELLQNEDFLLEDTGIDLVDLAYALEETFQLEPVEDLSNLETLGDLVDFVQSQLDQMD